MKKILFSLILALSISLPLHAFSAGWALSGEGRSGDVEDASFAVSVIIDLSDDRSITAEGSAAFGFDRSRRWGFDGFSASVGFNTFRATRHPFSFLFENTTIWSFRLSAGIMTDRNWNLYYSLSISPLHFDDVSFGFDFLNPFVYFDQNASFAGWGIRLIKVSYTF